MMTESTESTNRLNRLKLLIVDDEPPARKKIRTFLEAQENAPHMLISEAGNGIDALHMINEEAPDLVFLDIQMPGMTGFEVIEAVGVENMPAVVFVTAYDQYAIDAFEVQAIDYLLKPFHLERFNKSLSRALEKIETGKERPKDDMLRLLEQLTQGKKFSHRVMVKKGERYFFVKVRDIMYISAEEKYVKLHAAGETYLIRDTMSAMENRLDPALFARIHRSYIVNVDCIKEVQPWTHGDYVVLMKDGAKLSLSRRYSDRILK